MVRDHGALYNPLPCRATSLRCSHPHCHARLTGRVLHAALQHGIQALSHTWCAIKVHRTTKSTTWTTTQGSTAFHAWSLVCTSSLIPSSRKLDLVEKEGQEQKKWVMKRRCAVTNTRTVEFAVLMVTQCYVLGPTFSSPSNFPTSWAAYPSFPMVFCPYLDDLPIT